MAKVGLTTTAAIVGNGGIDGDGWLMGCNKVLDSEGDNGWQGLGRGGGDGDMDHDGSQQPRKVDSDSNGRRVVGRRGGTPYCEITGKMMWGGGGGGWARNANYSYEKRGAPLDFEEGVGKLKESLRKA
jgi:hypothetical protein